MMASGLNASGSSPWNKNPTQVDEPIQSVLEIMSEQLAEELQAENEIDPSIAQYGFTRNDFVDSKNDSELAEMIQEKFIREYEMLTKSDEDEPNIELSFQFEKYQPTYDSDFDFDGELSEDDDDLREIATNLLYSSSKTSASYSGATRDSSGQLVTKHNKEVMETKNCDRMMQLPIDLPTGDVVGEKISNKVYNKLRSCSKNEHRKVKVKDKDEKAVYELSVDKISRLILWKWMNNDLFSHIDSIIATGKESIVLHAVGSPREEDTQHFAIKIFKMDLGAFKNRAEYVQDDYRYKNPRRVLRVWAEREFVNLHRMVRAGMNCPKPIRLRKHLMVMSFIGTGVTAAPKLKYVIWEDEDSKLIAFNKVKLAMHCLFKKCNLVHGDLSEFNILYHNDDIYIIDVSQAMDVSHPSSLRFLLRDIENVLAYFQRDGTEGLPTATQLFNEITDLNMSDCENLSIQVENFEKDNRAVQLRHDKAKPADMDLRLYDADVAQTQEDPAKSYN